MTRFKDYKLIKETKEAGAFLVNHSPLYLQPAGALALIGARSGGMISQQSRDIDLGFDFVFHNRKYTKFRACCAGFVQLVDSQSTPVIADPVVPNPTSYYTLDDIDIEGTTNVLDRLDGNNGVISTNSGSPDITTGASANMFGQSFTFVPADSSLVKQFPDQRWYTATDTFCFSFWMKSTSGIDPYVMGNNVGVSGWQFEIVSDTIEFTLVNTAGSITITSTTAVADGSWHHIVLTYSGTSVGSTGLKLYIDGVSEGTGSGNITGGATGSSGLLAFGNKSFNLPTAGKYFDGSLDDIGMWYNTVVLTAEHALAIYNKCNNDGVPLGMNGPWATRKTQTPSSYWPLSNPTTSRLYIDPGVDVLSKKAFDLRGKKHATLSPGISLSTETPDSSAHSGINGSLQAANIAKDTINMGKFYGFAPNTPFTISMWIKVATGVTSGQIISKFGTDPDADNGSGEDYGWYFYVEGFKLKFTLRGELDGDVPFIRLAETGTTPVFDNAWHHIVITYNADTILAGGPAAATDLDIYLDGVTLATTPSSGGSILNTYRVNNPAVDLKIWGENNTFSPFGGEGNIAELAIWERALTSDEILNLYEQGSSGVPVALNPDTESNDVTLHDFGVNSNLYQNNRLLPGPIFAPWWNSTAIETNNLEIQTWLDYSEGIGRRKRIIQFPALAWYDHTVTNGNLLWYQIALHENTNIVEYRYLSSRTAGVVPAVPTGASCGIASLGKNQFRNFSVNDYINGGSTDIETTDLSVLAGTYPGDQAENVYIFKPDIKPLLNYRTKRKVLNDLDSSLQSYPLPRRTGDSSRSKPHNSIFDDRNTIVFSGITGSFPTTLNADHPAFMPLAASGIRNLLSSSGTNPPSGEFTSTKGTADNAQFLKLIKHSIPTKVAPFKEVHLFEQGQTSQFYTTGSAIEDVGLGFNAGLKSKKQIKLSLPIAASFDMLASTASINYYNTKTKTLDLVGGRDAITHQTAVIGAMGDARLFGPHGSLVVSGCAQEILVNPDQITPSCVTLNTHNELIDSIQNRQRTLALTGSLTTAGSGSSLYYDGSVTVHQSFNASGEQVIDTSDFLTGMFLLEKAVVQLPLKAGAGWFGDNTFCCFGSASNLNGDKGLVMDIGGPCVTVSLLRQNGVTGSAARSNFIESSPNGNVRRDVILSGTIIPTGDNISSFVRFTNPTTGDVQYDPKGFLSFGTPTAVIAPVDNTFTGSVTLEMQAAISNGILAYAHGTEQTGGGVLHVPGTWENAKIFQANGLGRAMDSEMSGRSFFGKDFTLLSGAVGPGDGAIDTTANTFFWEQHANSPYVLLPKDKLILAISKHRACRRSPPTGYPGSGGTPYYNGGFLNTTWLGPDPDNPSFDPAHDVGLSTGNIEITLYGSFVRAGEVLDVSTLNQYLTSNSIHEAIGEDDPVTDQFDVEKKEML